MLVKAVVDRFEGNLAVLIFEDEEKSIIWPRQYLPQNIGEGDFLQFDINIDVAATNAALQKNAALLEELARKE